MGRCHLLIPEHFILRKLFPMPYDITIILNNDTCRDKFMSPHYNFLSIYVGHSLRLLC